MSLPGLRSVSVACVGLLMCLNSAGIFANDKTEKKDETPKAVPDVVKFTFDKVTKVDGVDLPVGWQFKGKPFTKAAVFSVVKNGDGSNVLKVTADKATGTLICNSQPIDLKKTPIMRWRWRAVTLPDKADGRFTSKDDQAIAIYVGAQNGWFSKNSVAYRWETETPLGIEGKASYAGSTVQVKWFCVNNKKTPLNEWRIMEYNVASDYKKNYGKVPEKAVVSICSNSQYTGTSAEAEIDWIEFIPEKTPATK